MSRRRHTKIAVPDCGVCSRVYVFQSGSPRGQTVPSLRTLIRDSLLLLLQRPRLSFEWNSSSSSSSSTLMMSSSSCLVRSIWVGSFVRSTRRDINKKQTQNALLFVYSLACARFRQDVGQSGFCGRVGDNATADVKQSWLTGLLVCYLLSVVIC